MGEVRIESEGAFTARLYDAETRYVVVVNGDTEDEARSRAAEAVRHVRDLFRRGVIPRGECEGYETTWP